MEQKQFEEYLKKLKEIEETLSDDGDEEEFDLDFINEINNILLKLNQEIRVGDSEKKDFKLDVKIKKLHENASIPKYAKHGDAGMDLTAVNIEITDDYISYKTGLAFEIPYGYVGLLFPRSSNSKKDLLLTNSVGVLDSGYRGEVEFRFKPILNSKIEDISKYNIGDKVGQIIILPYPRVNFIETDELSNSERGETGFGSTGN
jgi:dUTP pyrophosphatase